MVLHVCFERILFHAFYGLVCTFILFAFLYICIILCTYKSNFEAGWVIVCVRVAGRGGTAQCVVGGDTAQ